MELKFTIEFYEKPNKKCPVKEYLKKQRKKTEDKILAYLQNIATIQAFRQEPYSRQIEGKLRELKVETEKGSHRIFYFMIINKRIILKSQFKDFIKSHPNTNFKRYIVEKSKRDPNIYYRVDKESEQLAIAAEIVALRKKHRLTQIQLAKKVKTSQSALAQIETGKRSPTTNTLIKIAEAIKK